MTNILLKYSDNSFVVVFLIFLASFAILEVILWRADQSRKSEDSPSPDSLPSVLALAQSLNAEGRGAVPEVKQNSAVDTLK